MCSRWAADSASIPSTLAAIDGSSRRSHKTFEPALVTSSLAYGSRISASGRSVSTARAAATMTAVLPTLVLMSQVSSWVRSELIECSDFRVGLVGRTVETRPQQGAAHGVVGQIFGYRAAQPGHLFAVVHGMHVPAVVGEPLSGIRPVGLVEGQGLDVDIEPEPLAHPRPAPGVAAGVNAEHFDGYPTARGAQRGEHFEEPVLGIAGQ